MKSDKEWLLWGKNDPLFAVSSWKGREKDGPNPWSSKEFYELGRADWADFSKRWSAYGFDRDHCLEIGCGAGRITAQLANNFEKVTATDVSADQIQLAQRSAQPKKIDFLLNDGTKLPLPDASVSAVFSCHVFQHFDSLDDALLVFRELHRVLVPGGSLCIHLPLFNLPSSPIAFFLRFIVHAWKSVGNLRAAIQRMRNALLMRGLPYEFSPLREKLLSIGYVDVETHGFCMSSNQGWHDVLFARKSIPTPR